MADLVKLTIDGRELQAAPGTLVIDAAKAAGIEVPAFCYYEGLTLAAACRMCLVEVEKMPKMMTACTLPVAEGMVVRTETEQVRQARKYTLEFLLTNHPLDCPVCDKGGECELQDMVFRYGAGESRFTEQKIHVDEKQWSPVVFYDMPRCILRSEEHTSELQSQSNLVCRLLLEKKKRERDRGHRPDREPPRAPASRGL